jgi:hypothetical protein
MLGRVSYKELRSSESIGKLYAGHAIHTSAGPACGSPVLEGSKAGAAVGNSKTGLQRTMEDTGSQRKGGCTDWTSLSCENSASQRLILLCTTAVIIHLRDIAIHAA